MDWMKIGWALLLGSMILILLPRAKQMLRHSPAAPPGGWQTVTLVLLAVAGFVMLLVLMVR
jgi:hypothetical protein